jgi:hypothetical protein
MNALSRKESVSKTTTRLLNVYIHQQQKEKKEKERRRFVATK